MSENTLIVLALKNEVEALRMKEKFTLQGNKVLSIATKKGITKLLKEQTVDLLVTDMEITDTDAIEFVKK